MKKNESDTFSGIWIVKRDLIYLHPYQVKVILYIQNILLLMKYLYIIIRANPSLGADYFYPHSEFIRLRSPLVGSGKAVTKGSSTTAGRINPGA